MNTYHAGAVAGITKHDVIGSGSEHADLAFERHYTCAEIAELWGLSRQSVERIFRDEPGVLRLGRPESRYKRSYFSLRIPESVMKRVHAQLQRPN